MNNLLSYCGLIDERMSTSDKDLPVQKVKSLVRPLMAYQFESGSFFSGCYVCEACMYCKVSVCSQATFFNDFGRQKLPDSILM